MSTIRILLPQKSLFYIPLSSENHQASKIIYCSTGRQLAGIFQASFGFKALSLHTHLRKIWEHSGSYICV